MGIYFFALMGNTTKGEKMKKEKKEEKVPAGMFMLLAEDAKAVNTYASLGPSGQQIFLERFMGAGSKEEERRLIEELTR